MDVPTKDARPDGGLMFTSNELERGAQASIAKADAADQAQRKASSSGNAKEPYVVTRPKGRTVIVAKKRAQEPGTRPEANAAPLATYNPSHPSVLFHRLKHGLMSRIEVSSLRKRLTQWLRTRSGSRDKFWRQTRHARGGETRLIQHRSGLIIPSPDEPFMLSETQHAMGDLMAENQRLRRLVDEILCTDPAEVRRMRSRPSGQARH